MKWLSRKRSRQIDMVQRHHALQRLHDHARVAQL